MSLPPPIDETTAKFHNVKILIAEDEPEMRQLLLKTLQHEGFQVTVAKNGEEALQCLKEDPEKFDLLVSDLKMPRLGGEALIPKAKEVSPHLKIIISSAYAEIEQYLALMNKGAFDFICKPFKIPDLLEIIDRALEQKSESE